MKHADRFFWKPSQWSRACELAEDGKSCEEIAADLSLTPRQVFNKFMNESYVGRYDAPLPTLGGVIAARRPIAQWKQRAEVDHASALADRDRRDALRARQNLTAIFFGDPPPGYSALDQMRKARAQAS